jgi:CheY-like chemotaxis protein/HPt (histidine-containing phosphotransfer) domain-containing protein
MLLDLALPIADPAELVSAATVPGDVLGAVIKARRSAPSIGHAESDGTLVLVVDDHPTNRSLLVRQVNTLGYAAESAADGVEALVHWMSGRYGIVVTDCNMPGMNGYELARKIREVESGREGKRTAIIACTANALRGEAEICLTAGMDAYLVKPIDLTELARTLDRWLPLPKMTTVLDRTVLVAISGGKVAIESEILADFRRVNDDDAKVLRLAVERHDMVQMTSASHRIKGASRAVGAEPLAAVCERLERASQADDWDTIEAHMGLFDLELERLNNYCTDAAAASPA